MIIVLKAGTTEEEIKHITDKITGLGLRPHVSKGTERIVIGVIGDERLLRDQPIEAMAGVEKVMPVVRDYKLASRDFKAEDSVIDLGDGVTVGGKEIAIMAGPCAVESREQLMRIAGIVKAKGAKILRGGAFKPRTSPYSFQGLGLEGLKILGEAGKEFGLKVVTEVMDPRDVEAVARYADILQVGARNVQNFPLLREVGKVRKPVLLKRGLSTKIKELLLSAEYILSGGNYNVMVCERGIRTFEEDVRNTLPANAIPVLKELTHLPVIVDPSHAAGKWRYVSSLARAGVAAGADGLIIEVHDNPEEALSDGPQALKPDTFEALMGQLKAIAKAVGREIKN